MGQSFCISSQLRKIRRPNPFHVKFRVTNHSNRGTVNHLLPGHPFLDTWQTHISVRGRCLGSTKGSPPGVQAQDEEGSIYSAVDTSPLASRRDGRSVVAEIG